MYERPRRGEAGEPVILVARIAGIDPGTGAANAVPAPSVSAGVEAQAAESLVAPVAAVALLPEWLCHELACYADIEPADLACRHVVHFEVGRQVGVPVGGERDILGRPVDEVGALLAANLTLAVEKVLVMGILAEADPAPDVLVPENLLFVVMRKCTLLADRMPVDSVGRGVNAGEAGAAGWAKRAAAFGGQFTSRYLRSGSLRS